MKMKQFAQAAERNKEPILEVLKSLIVKNHGENYQELKLMEVSSGTGQHVAHFAKALPKVTFQPSEYDDLSLISINAYAQDAKVTNIKPAVKVDISVPPGLWPGVHYVNESLDFVLCINMTHITPWKCSQGLFTGALQLLKTGGLLVTYGPHKFDNVISPKSNVRFDESLKARNPEWGLRDVNAMKQLAMANFMTFVSIHEMPANNHMMVFRKT